MRTSASSRRSRNHRRASTRRSTSCKSDLHLASMVTSQEPLEEPRKASSSGCPSCQTSRMPQLPRRATSQVGRHPMPNRARVPTSISNSSSISNNNNTSSSSVRMETKAVVRRNRQHREARRIPSANPRTSRRLGRPRDHGCGREGVRHARQERHVQSGWQGRCKCPGTSTESIRGFEHARRSSSACRDKLAESKGGHIARAGKGC